MDFFNADNTECDDKRYMNIKKSILLFEVQIALASCLNELNTDLSSLVTKAIASFRNLLKCVCRFILCLKVKPVSWNN